MNYTTIYPPHIFEFYSVEVAYGLPEAQSATSLWTVKGAFMFVIDGKVRLVAVGDLKE